MQDCGLRLASLATVDPIRHDNPRRGRRKESDLGGAEFFSSEHEDLFLPAFLSHDCHLGDLESAPADSDPR